MPLLGMVRIVVIAGSDFEARALAAPAYARWFKTFTFLSRTRNLPVPNLPKSFEQALDDGFCLVGSPSTVREALKSLVVEAGVRHTSCANSLSETCRSLHRSKRSRPCDRPSFPISRGKCQTSCSEHH